MPASPAPKYTALVVEGGAMRGVFSTGVLDVFLENKFNPFDMYIGVSSGAGNLAAYLAEMPGRNLKIYADYSRRPEFISFYRFLRGGHLMDLDWLWEITISEIRLDLPVVYARGKPFIVCLTDVHGGKAVYKNTCAENLENVLKASSALPLLYRHFPRVDGVETADGGLTDGLPVAAAILRTARRIMVLRSRPKRYKKQKDLMQPIVNLNLRHYPALRAAMTGRVGKYNDAISLIRRPPPGVSIIEICPPENFRPSRLSRNREALLEGYNQGRALAREAMARWASG
ncbi:MAG: patatin family protein [Pseudomonadota bacterium]